MSPQLSIPLFLSLVAFFVADDENLFSKWLLRRSLESGDRQKIESKLSYLGRSGNENFENFRISQLAYIAIAISFASILLALSFIGWREFAGIALISPLLIVAATEHNLSIKVEARKREVESEFPVLVEMLTLAVGAGESPATAIKRITQRAHGHLAREFASVVQEIESGKSFTYSLDDLSKKLDSEALRRFVDSLIIAISRGTPLVETLTHSANESRNQERVRLLTAAGKSEISMMIPVVFLILPISILFALYPSLTNLNLFTS